MSRFTFATTPVEVERGKYDVILLRIIGRGGQILDPPKVFLFNSALFTYQYMSGSISASYELTLSIMPLEWAADEPKKGYVENTGLCLMLVCSGGAI